VQAWYQGGISVIDFTDSANPREIAYFDRGPVDEEHLVVAGFWSAYWYDGYIYGTEIVRGLDVLALVPSEHLSPNEIAAARLADQGALFNPQQQFQVTWPADPVVASAYVDQLERSESLPENVTRELRAVLESAVAAVESGAADRKLSKQIAAVADQLGDAMADATAEQRRVALVEILGMIAERLR